MRNGEADLFLTDWWADYPAPENFNGPLSPSRNNGPGGNYAFLNDPDRDSMILRARSTTDESRAEVRESPLANSVTSCPRATSASVTSETTRSTPPYPGGGTGSPAGAICAIFKASTPSAATRRTIRTLARDA